MSPSCPVSLIRALLAVATVAAIAACTPTVQTHGYQIDERRMAEIRPGTTSREEVARILGTPSTLATFDDRSWYYISQRVERTNFFKEELVAQDVVRIAFDERGIVSDVGKADLASAETITPDPERTRTLGNELSLAQQLLGNIGRFNSDQGTGFRPRPPGGGF